MPTLWRCSHSHASAGGLSLLHNRVETILASRWGRGAIDAGLLVRTDHAEKPLPQSQRHACPATFGDPNEAAR